MAKSFALYFNVSMFDARINEETSTEQLLSYYYRNELKL